MQACHRDLSFFSPHPPKPCGLHKVLISAVHVLIAGFMLAPCLCLTISLSASYGYLYFTCTPCVRGISTQTVGGRYLHLTNAA